MNRKSKVGLKVTLGVIGVLALSVLLIISFYFISFYKLNELLGFSAKKNADELPNWENSYFTYEQVLELKLIDDQIGEDDFVKYSTKRKITDISWGYIEYTIPYEAHILDWDTQEVKAECSGTRQISFRFDTKDFRWEVESVKRL